MGHDIMGPIAGPNANDDQPQATPAPELPVLGDIARVPGLSLPVGSANWNGIIKQLHIRAILALGFGILYEIRKAPVKLTVDVPAFTDIGWAPIGGVRLDKSLELPEVKTEAELKERWDTDKGYYVIARLRTPESVILLMGSLEPWEDHKRAMGVEPEA